MAWRVLSILSLSPKIKKELKSIAMWCGISGSRCLVLVFSSQSALPHFKQPTLKTHAFLTTKVRATPQYWQVTTISRSIYCKIFCRSILPVICNARTCAVPCRRKYPYRRVTHAFSKTQFLWLWSGNPCPRLGRHDPCSPMAG